MDWTALWLSLRLAAWTVAILLPVSILVGRLLAYREAMHLRGGPISAADAVGRCLLAFASDGARTAGAPLAYAIELLERYAAEATELLRQVYGEVQLPEDVPPSVVRRDS